MTHALAEFHGLHFQPIQHHNQLWLTAEQAGQALGFAADNARKGINKLYDRHADEFSAQDTCVVKMTSQGQARATRIFSATGCQLLGFFASTPRAKAFRAWAKQALVARAPAAPERSFPSRVRITRAVEADVLSRYARGQRQVDISRALGISGTVVNQLVRGKYQFSPAAGEPCCPPELLDAVARYVLEDEQTKLDAYAQSLAGRLRNTANNQALAQRIDAVGRHLQQPLDAAMLPMNAEQEDAQ